MLLKVKHIGAASLVFLYIFSLSIYTNSPLFDISETGTNSSLSEQHFISNGYDGIPYALLSENSYSCTTSNNFTVKLQFRFGSDNINFSNSLIELKDAGYVNRFKAILVHPQIFDILFPFHYYS
jgi:hypothetical protein